MPVLKGEVGGLPVLVSLNGAKVPDATRAERKMTPPTVPDEPKVADLARGKPAERIDVAEVLPPLVEIAAPRSGTRITLPQLEIKVTVEPWNGW